MYRKTAQLRQHPINCKRFHTDCFLLYRITIIKFNKFQVKLKERRQFDQVSFFPWRSIQRSWSLSYQFLSCMRSGRCSGFPIYPSSSSLSPSSLSPPFRWCAHIFYSCSFLWPSEKETSTANSPENLHELHKQHARALDARRRFPRWRECENCSRHSRLRPPTRPTLPQNYGLQGSFGRAYNICILKWVMLVCNTNGFCAAAIFRCCLSSPCSPLMPPGNNTEIMSKVEDFSH
jgi:hypothetical protein